MDRLLVAYAPQAHGPETLFICVVETAPRFPNISGLVSLGLKLLLILQSAMLVVLAWLCRSTD